MGNDLVAFYDGSAVRFATRDPLRAHGSWQPYGLSVDVGSLHSACQTEHPWHGVLASCH